MKGVGKLQEKRLISAVKFYKENSITITACAEKFSCDRHALSRWLKKSGLKINPHGKQLLNSDKFSCIDTEEKAYWLGFLYADGNVRENKISLELAVKDKEHLEKFNQFMEKEKDILTSGHRVRCLFMDKKVYQDLVNLGVVPNKSLILKFPNYNQVPKNLIRHFIRGYVDGDGSLSYTTTGKLVKTSFLKETNVADLLKGNYIVKITTNKGVQTEKFIKE